MDARNAIPSIDKNMNKHETPKSPGNSNFSTLLPFILIAGLILAGVIYQMGNISEARKAKSADSVNAQEEQLKQEEVNQQLREQHAEMVIREGELRTQHRDGNIELGIPEDYPIFKFPVFPELEIIESSKEDALSNLGEEMDKWYIHGEIDADKKIIEEFYRDRMSLENMRQTQYISIPSGYALNYANEWYDVAITIEKKQSDSLVQVELTIHRVRDDSVNIGN